jgi:Arf-GAP/coiled-coil/ANK repeat/PH domain-containing protein
MDKMIKFLDRYLLILSIYFVLNIFKNNYAFHSRDLKQIKEQRKQFERLSNDVENALTKNSESSKTKLIVCEENEKNVLALRKSFGHVSLEYICQINKFYFKRSLSVLDMV